MADQKVSQLNSLTKSTLATNDVFPVVDTSASETKKITYGELLQPLDSNFRIAGSSDSTKLLAFEVDGFTTGTTRTITVPDSSITMVGTDAPQVLSNKTITSPQINFGSDADGDLIVRSGGITTRFAAGSEGSILAIVGGAPAYIANPAAANASTTVKGVSEEGTQSEVDSGTATGGTSARLFINPSTLRSRLRNDAVIDTGAANAYVITPAPAITAYSAYQEFTFKAANTNTGASTLNVNGLGVKTIKKNGSVDLTGGDISAGMIIVVMYDGTNMQLVSSISTTGNMAVGTFTPSAGTGNKSLTGLGFKPSMVQFFVNIVVPNGGNRVQTNSAGAATSSTSRWCQATMSDANSTASALSVQSVNQIIEVWDGSHAASFIADFVSMDTDGFTISATTNSSSPIISYIAYK